jgi:flagellar motor switch protein FliG
MPQDIDILDPVPARLTQDMSARTKAAIVVRFLMQEGAEIDLASLPTSLQADLTREIAAVVLSKLDVTKAATLLSEMPGPKPI